MKIRCKNKCPVVGVRSTNFTFIVECYYECNKKNGIYYIYFNNDYIADDGKVISEYFDLLSFERKYKLMEIDGNKNEKV